MGERALVTGGAGFIGSHICDELLRQGYAVRILDNLEPQVHGTADALPAYVNREVEFIPGDVRDPAVVARALSGVDFLFHHASAVGVAQSMYEIRRYTEINSLGGATVLDVIANDPSRRPRKMVVASSMSLYGEGAYRCVNHSIVYPPPRHTAQLAQHEWQVHCPHCGEPVVAVPTTEDKPARPESIYAIGKRDHEEMFLVVGRAYDIPTVALRYWQVYGTRQALSNPYTGVAAIFCSRILGGHPPPIFEDGAQLRDFIHVSDIARATVQAMQHPKADFHAINIGTGRSLTVLQVAHTLLEAMGSTLQPETLGAFRPGDVRDCIPDVTRARELLGFEATVSFEQGARDLVDWVAQQTDVEDRFAQSRQELAHRELGQTRSTHK
ncbi:MAG: nucleoside-diphosphate sugar epimerase [Dehalococcoidia bacterium]|nr:nucleoside-diphosphate sugar epimerase [Dehalococcoidia bacterium]